MEIRGLLESIEDSEEVLAGFGFKDDLPGVAGVGALVESRHWRGNNELFDAEFLGRLNNFCVQFADVLDGRFFGFASQREFEQKTVGR